jgi:hypothetical protein
VTRDGLAVAAARGPSPGIATQSGAEVTASR